MKDKDNIAAISLILTAKGTFYRYNEPEYPNPRFQGILEDLMCIITSICPKASESVLDGFGEVLLKIIYDGRNNYRINIDYKVSNSSSSSQKMTVINLFNDLNNALR